MSFGGWLDSIALEVPPAPAGSEPRLALSTNHMVADGILGAGYQLDGLSAIVRRGAEGGVPDLGGDDSYYLDGQRLVRVSQGSTGEIYQPEMFDGSQLEHDAATNTWTMARDGWTFVFGSRSGTGTSATKLLDLDPPINPPTDGPVRLLTLCLGGNKLCNAAAWHLSRVEDPHHNVLTYNYRVPALPQDIYRGYEAADTGEHLLDNIRYNGGDALVRLIYAPRPDPQISYTSGTPSFATERLAEIVSFGRDDVEFSRYRIEYKDEGGADCDGNPVSGVDEVGRPLQSLVRRVIRVGTSGHADAGRERVVRCIQTHHEQVAFAAADDVSADIPAPLGSSVPFNTLLPVPLHLDGDGIEDLILLAYSTGSGGTRWEARHQAFRATPRNAKAFEASGPEVDAWVQLLTDKLPAQHFEERRSFALADLDRDGWADLIYETIPPDGSRGDVQLARWDPSGSRFSVHTLDILACDLRYGQFVDINGDGFTDLVRLAHGEGEDDCVARPSEWLPNSGLVPWLDRGGGNADWRPLSTPAAAIAAAGTITPPDLDQEWEAEDYVEAQARFHDLNGDGLQDLAYALWQRWHEVCDTDDDECWQEPDWTGHFSRIYWGDGRGGFQDSGLSTGGPVLTRRTGISDQADSRILHATQSATDFMRSGRVQLLTTYNTSGNGLFGAKWRGIRWGFGDDAVTGDAAQPAASVRANFTFELPQQPGLGDFCFNNSSWLTYGDFDGDGYTDLLSFNFSEDTLPGCGTTYCAKLYLNARSVSEGRITASDGAWGGRTTLTWRSSTDGLAGNASLSYPGALEVLREWNGEAGPAKRHYAYPTQTQGKFQGFGLVEQESARGGLERFAFGVSPPMAGKLLYAARVRSDNTLERVSVTAYRGEADADCAPEAECVQAPLYGEPSSYTLDVLPPFANLPVRQCEYEVERSAPGQGGAVSVAGLIDHCHRWNGRDAPSASQLLAAAGLYRYPGLGWPAYLLSRAVWPDEVRLGESFKQAIALSDADEPDGDHRELWAFPELLDWTTGAREITSRWDAPAGAPMPPPADLEKLAQLNDAAAGRGFSAHVVDREYGDAAHELVQEYLHRDVLTTADDLRRVNAWEAPPLPDWSSATLPERRLTGAVLFDVDQRQQWSVIRTNFDPGSFDNPERVTVCGRDGQGCRTERFTYHANGMVATRVRPDGASETLDQAPFCGTETITDAAGRTDVRSYDERCRLVAREVHGVSYDWAYDGQNRIVRRSVTPNGGGPAVSVTVSQDDQFQHVEDSLYQEPRLRERRLQDGRQWLTYLDEFGRVTKRVVCVVDSGILLPNVCLPGTQEVLEHLLWGTDGTVYATARPYVRIGPGAETPAFAVLTRDGAGRVILHREPAHVDLATEAADWITTRVWYAPGRIVSEDPLDRISVLARDTRSQTLMIAGQTLSRSEFDALGRPTSQVGPEGVEIHYTYTPRGQLATAARAVTPPSVVDGALAPVPWRVRSQYDVLGRPTLAVQPDGTAREVVWDPIGRPLEVRHVDRAGVSTPLRTLSYATANDGVVEMTSVDENGHSTAQHFDGLGRKLDEDDGLGTVRTWSYGVDSNPSRMVERDGELTLTTRFGYDVAGRLTAHTDPDGGTTSYVYNGAGGVVQTTGPHGEHHTYSHFFSGRPFEARLRTDRGSWLLEQTRYDDAARPRVRLEGGVRRTIVHDDLDRPVRNVVGSGQAAVATVVQYDGTSQRLRQVDRLAAGAAAAAVTRFQYDDWGRLQALENPDGDISRFRYDVIGRLRFSIDAEDFETETRYDDRGRVVLQTGLGSDVTRLSYAADTVFRYHDGREAGHQYRVTSTDAAGHSTERWFDPLGRLTAVARADNTRTERSYAGTRLVDEFKVGFDGAAVAQTRATYLTNGILAGWFGPAEPQAFAAFDPLTFAGEWVRFGIARGSRLEWIDAGGERTDFEYGSDGLLQAERFRGLVRTVERPNPASSPSPYPRVIGEALARDAGGPVRSISYAFDTAGRLTERKAFDSQVVELATWDRFDQDGRPRRDRNFLDGVLQVEHLWDISLAGRPLSRRTTVAGAAPRVTRWSWLRNGAREREIGPNGDGFVYGYGLVFDWEVDSVTRVSGAPLAEIAARDSRGLPRDVRVGPNSRIVLDYDALGRLEHSRRTGPGNAVELETRLTYDALGRVSREDFADGATAWANAYTYSPAGRLLGETRERGGANEMVTYEVNAAGYRTATRGTLDGIDQTMTAIYDPKLPAERLVAVGFNGKDTPIVYDAWDGVLTDQHGQQFTYSPRGELLTVQAGKSLYSFLRDADGIAWGEVGERGLRLTTWDLDLAGRPLQVEDPDAGVFGYAHAGGVLVGRIDYAPPGVVSQSAGITGTLLSEAGTSRTAGSAFGVGLAPAAAPGERMLYAGLETLPDGNGLHLARRRAYDAQMGIFLSPDPLGLAGGLRRSLYASGDPVNRFDPLGLKDCALGGGMPDLGSGPIDVRPPAYVEGLEGGPASPFGPGVAVSYVDQYAGDKTFTERMNNYLVATSAGVFSFDWAEMFNEADDTDASQGSNSGSGFLFGLFAGGSASDAIINRDVTQPKPEPETPEPQPSPVGGMPNPLSTLTDLIEQIQQLDEQIQELDEQLQELGEQSVESIRQAIETTPGPVERNRVAAEAIRDHAAARYGAARHALQGVVDCAEDPRCRSGVARDAAEAVRQGIQTVQQDPTGTAYNVGVGVGSGFVGTIVGGVEGVLTTPFDAQGLGSGDPVAARQAVEALEKDLVAQVETILVVIPAGAAPRVLRGAGRPFMRWLTQRPHFELPEGPIPPRVRPGGAGPKDVLVRRGLDYESTSRLDRQAKAAEQHGFPHGVSVTAQRAEDAATATREAFEDAGFPVHHTPTRADPMHHTVELPAPVTPDVARKFNAVLGRRR